uniref:Uncharacterized protein n=1 Tax=viral metagenome TaxID=1070528 RepID=A0A6C0CG37_9ZZZZ
MLPLNVDNQSATILFYLVLKVKTSLSRVKHVCKYDYDGKTEQLLLSCGKEGANWAWFQEHHERDKIASLSISEITDMTRPELEGYILQHLNDFSDDPDDNSTERFHKKIQEGCILVCKCEHLKNAF